MYYLHIPRLNMFSILTPLAYVMLSLNKTHLIYLESMLKYDIEHRTKLRIK